LYSIDYKSKKNTIEKIKAALIGLGLTYVPEDEDEKKHPLKRGGASSPFES
tara:strand:+ start:364 stop:516 length:153 start_codon:yes stop_codon:yes gene_type:complete